MGFWENVESVREYKNLTRKELSAKAKFSIASISTGLARGSTPSADIAVRIALVLGVSVEYLITGEDKKSEMPASPKVRKLLELFSILDERDKQTVLNLVESLSDRYANGGETEKSSFPAG